MRLGLRAQIVLALSLVFLLAVWSLGFVTLQITRRSAEVSLLRSERSLARVLVPVLGKAVLEDEAQFQALCRELQLHAGLAGLALIRNSDAKRCGRLDTDRDTGVMLSDGTRLVVALTPTRDPSGAAYANLLLFYMAITGLAVLLLAYLLLTYLIVRPIDRLTQSVEGLGSGAEHVSVKEQGSAEAARLARTFNDMAQQLRAKHNQLTHRLAELERTTEDLRNKEQQLIHGEKLASVGRLAAGIAHEIGNPLAAILGLLELLREGDLAPEQNREFLQRVQRETERINRIIRDLLDFARRDAVQESDEETSDLRVVIDDTVNLVRPQKESKDIAIDVHIDPRTREVIGSRHRLSQIALNLLLNAVDALEGKGRIEVRAEPSDETHVALSVSDSGPGIASEMQDKLFEPFTTTKPAGKGTGLGLAVTHAIVESLGGDIQAFNKAEGGAKFVVQLRVSGSSPRSLRPPQPQAQPDPNDRR